MRIRCLALVAGGACFVRQHCIPSTSRPSGALLAFARNPASAVLASGANPCYFVETANLAAQNDEIAWIDSVSGKTGGRARLVSCVQTFERPVPPARGRLDASSLGQAGFGCLASCARGLLDALSDKRGFLPVSHDCCHSSLAG